MGSKASKSPLEIIKSAWKILFAFFTIISGLVALQTLGLLDPLVSVLASFASAPIPIYWFIIFVMVFIFGFYLSRRYRTEEILDHNYARRLVKLCQTPRTTEDLKSQYDAWERQVRSAGVIFGGGYGFHDYMKRLERAGFVEFVDGKWQSKRKGLEMIEKYYGE